MTETEIYIKTGQHFVCGFPGTSMDTAFIQAVKKYKISNIILFAWNVESREQLYRLCNDIQALVHNECGCNALICMDQEGGMITRLSDECTNIPGAMALSAAGSTDAVYTANRLSALELKALGVNCNFAPVLDVNNNPDNPVIGVRSYGDTGEQVYRHAAAAIQGQRETGMLCVGKHFPGHGNTAIDSHLDLPCIKDSGPALDMHVLPFKKTIQDGIQGIMTSHILFPHLEPEQLPATLSRKILTGFLKHKLGFSGLVFSDCMEMKAVADHYGTVPASLQALRAGVDLVCISHHVELACETSRLLYEQLQKGLLDIQEFEASTQKILKYKYELSVHKRPPLSCVGSPEHKRINREILKKTFTLVRDVPFNMGSSPVFIGPECFRASNVSNNQEKIHFSTYMQMLCGGIALKCSPSPSEQEIHDLAVQAEQGSSIIIGTYNGHLNPGQILLVNTLAGSRPLLCAALRNPYDLGLVDPRVRSYALYAYTRDVFDLFASLLAGEFKAEGILPVSMPLQ